MISKELTARELKTASMMKIKEVCRKAKASGGFKRQPNNQERAGRNIAPVGS